MYNFLSNRTQSKRLTFKRLPSFNRTFFSPLRKAAPRTLRGRGAANTPLPSKPLSFQKVLLRRLSALGLEDWRVSGHQG